MRHTLEHLKVSEYSNHREETNQNISMEHYNKIASNEIENATTSQQNVSNDAYGKYWPHAVVNDAVLLAHAIIFILIPLM